MVDRQERNLKFYRQWRSQECSAKDIQPIKSREFSKNSIGHQNIAQSHAQYTGNIPSYKVDKARLIKKPSLALSIVRDVEQALVALSSEKQAKYQTQIQKLHLLIEDKKVNLQETEARVQSFKQVITHQAPPKNSTALEKKVKERLKSKDKKLPKNLLKAGLIAGAVGAVGAAVLAAEQIINPATKTAKALHVKAFNLSRPIGAYSSNKSPGLNAASQSESQLLMANTANNGIGPLDKSAGGDIPKKFMPTQQSNPGIVNTQKTPKLGPSKDGPGGSNRPGNKPNASKSSNNPPKADDKPGSSGSKSPKPLQTPQSNILAGSIGGIAGAIIGTTDGIASGIANGIANGIASTTNSTIDSTTNSTISSDGNNGSNAAPVSLGNPSNPGNIDDLQKKIEALEKELKNQKEAQKKLEEEAKKQKEQIDAQKKQLEETNKQIEETQKQLTEAMKQMEETKKEIGEKMEEQFKMWLANKAWDGAKGIYNYATEDTVIIKQITLEPVLECPNCNGASSSQDKNPNSEDTAAKAFQPLSDNVEHQVI